MENHIPTLTFHQGGWCEELEKSYEPGVYQPKSAAEFHALKVYAHNPPDWAGSDNPEKDALVARAVEIKALNDKGKPYSPSTAERAGVEVLRAAIAAREARIELELKAEALKDVGLLDKGLDLAPLTDEELAAKIEEAEKK